MSRLLLSGALSLLKIVGLPRHNSLCFVSRNLSTSASRSSRGRAPRRQRLREPLFKENVSFFRGSRPKPLRLKPLSQQLPEDDVSFYQESPENSTFPKQDGEFSSLKQEESGKQDPSLSDLVKGPSDNNNTSSSASLAEKTVSLPIDNRDQPTTTTFLKMWLRDNCPCSKCVHPETKQRMVDTFAIPEDISVQNIQNKNRDVKVTWSDGHTSHYPRKWLALNTYTGAPRPTNTMIKFRKFKTWNPAPSELDYPTVSYQDVMRRDSEVAKWLQHIYDWGFCFVKETPANPEATEALLKRIAHIRHTHYGGFWDFTADLSFGDTAYTNEALGAHTDNTYFTDPARLQLFHLLSHTDGDGGATLLVDGFRAAKRLYYENLTHLEILINKKHPFHASGNQDSVIQPVEQHPTIKTNPQFGRLIYQLRWNNYDRAPKWNWALEAQEDWYKAAKHFNSIIHREDMEIWLQLEPGTALIFDNWRMLHGRSAFTGKRRMCGGYISNDDFLSRYRVLKFGRSKVMRHLGDTSLKIDNPNAYF